MRSPTFIIAVLIIIGVSVLVGRGASMAAGGVFAAVILLLLTVATHESEVSHQGRRDIRNVGEAPREGSSGIMELLTRIEARLTKLETGQSKATPAHNGDNKELKALQEKTLSEVANVLKTLSDQRTLLPAPGEVDSGNNLKLAELSGALSEAIKEISKRDASIDVLVANASKANIQRPLIRLTQLLEVTRTLKARVSEGKSAADESFEFLVEDMAAALEDFGVEHLELTPGAKVADLPAGCFAAISVVETDDLALRGTVKEVRSRAFFISEEGKKPRFIAPAKVILYRG